MTDVEAAANELDREFNGNMLSREIDKASLKKAVDAINVEDGISDEEMKTIRELIAFDTEKAYIDTHDDELNRICPGCGLTTLKDYVRNSDGELQCPECPMIFEEE